MVKMIQNLKNRIEKIQESITKGLEEIKDKPTETTQLLKLETLYKESVAEYLRQKKG